MPNRQHPSGDSPSEYFIKDLPATHNPLIGILPVDTLNNTRNALCTLREFSENPGVAPKQEANTGFYSLMTCVIDALDFEIHGRE
ncbi:hypothetical protein [Saccharospirillum salsuginis]|uniref:Uncharacterized protein n=1 Tax=Saccharospirillum salsuginis TaxID=418750 RepID=A0A918NBA3_9GAMM|nr:hypothetical protein [Saccharospirillum salsuginis]GGX59802.1 hypothetical protein GCM10007392_29740 [Saccharospirillum salsuginis]